MNKLKYILIGCLLTIFLYGLFFILPPVVFKYAESKGYIPAPRALSQKEIHERQIKQLKKWKIVEEDENILFLASDGAFSLKEEGNLFTEKRVITYHQEAKDQLNITDAYYSQIVYMDFKKSTSVDEYSFITITRDDGVWIVLTISPEDNRDEIFYTELKKRWEENTYNP